MFNSSDSQSVDRSGDVVAVIKARLQAVDTTRPPSFTEPAVGFSPMTALEAHSSVTVFVQYAIGTELRHIVDNEGSARIGHDPDGIHQVRAATRRLRVHLAHLEPVIDPRWSASTRAELRRFGQAFGGVRDLDVMRDILSACAASLPPVEVHQLEPLFNTITRERAAAHVSMVEELDSDRYRSLLASLAEAISDPPLGIAHHQHADAIARAMTIRAWDRLEDAVNELGATPSDAALHDVRRRAKRARFAAELTIPVTDAKTRKLAKALAKVQLVLGTQHDAVVAHHWVRQHAAHETSEVNFAAGMVAGLLRNASQTAAREFPEVWQNALRKRTKSKL